MTPKTKTRIAAGIGGAFSALTIAEGSAVLLGIIQPPYVVLQWLLLYNVVMGFVGFGTAVVLWMSRRWARILVLFIAAAHAAVFATLGILLAIDSPVAMHSVQAMAMRSAVWSVIAWIAWKSVQAIAAAISPTQQTANSR
jgi:hypothetical protein